MKRSSHTDYLRSSWWGKTKRERKKGGLCAESITKGKNYTGNLTCTRIQVSSRTQWSSVSQKHRICEEHSCPVTKHRNRLSRQRGVSLTGDIPELSRFNTVLWFMDHTACAGMLDPLRPPLSSVAEGETGIHLSVIKSVMHQQHPRINEDEKISTCLGSVFTECLSQKSNREVGIIKEVHGKGKLEKFRNVAHFCKDSGNSGEDYPRPS